MTTVPIDSRDGVIWFDGAFVDWKDAKVHVLTHALHYGSAIFEGERAYGGAIYKLSQMLQQQSLVMSYADVFLMLTVLFVGLSFTMPLVSKPQAAAGGGGGH